MLESLAAKRPALANDATASAVVLRFDRVRLQFDGRPALANVSLEVRVNETVILLGAVGSGKTVLLKAAIGLIQPDEGDVYLFGQNISSLPEERLFPLRHQVGVLFQEAALFDSL